VGRIQVAATHNTPLMSDLTNLGGSPLARLVPSGSRKPRSPLDIIVLDQERDEKGETTTERRMATGRNRDRRAQRYRHAACECGWRGTVGAASGRALGHSNLSRQTCQGRSAAYSGHARLKMRQ